MSQESNLVESSSKYVLSPRNPSRQPIAAEDVPNQYPELIKVPKPEPSVFEGINYKDDDQSQNSANDPKNYIEQTFMT